MGKVPAKTLSFFDADPTLASVAYETALELACCHFEFDLGEAGAMA